MIDQANQRDIGYMLRWRKSATDQWKTAHVLMMYLFFAPPEYAYTITQGESVHGNKITDVATIAWLYSLCPQ